MKDNKTASEIQEFCEQMGEMMDAKGDRARAEAFWIVRNMIQMEYLEEWNDEEH